MTNDAVLGRADFVTRAVILEQAGDVAIHLRAHETPVARQYELGERLRALASCLIVNDRVDLALALDAAGVHLRGDSMPIETVRQLVGERLIGYSAHSIEEAVDAERKGANYVFLGTMYETPSHPGQPRLGARALQQAARRLRIPVIAIGGIDRRRAAVCRRQGAYGVAAIRSVWLTRTGTRMLDV